MTDESKRTELDVLAHEERLLRDWLNDQLVTSHTMTPLKAKRLAEELLAASDRAEKLMPKL